MSKGLSRRAFLRSVGFAGAGMALAACGATPTPTPTPKPMAAPAAPTAAGVVPTAKPATSPLSGQVDFFHVWGGTRVPWMDTQIADFKALYPNITINNNLIPQDGMNEKYLTAIAGGTPPDVIMMYRSNLPNFAARGALTALDELIAKSGINMRQVFYDTEVDKSMWEGKVYTMPQIPGAAVYLTFANTDILKQVGLEARTPNTWQEMVEFSSKMVVKQGDNLTRIGMAFPLAPYVQMVGVNGGAVLTADGKKVAFNTPEGIEALQWQVDSCDKLYGSFEKQGAFNATAGGSAAGLGGGAYRTAFYQGKAGMYMDGVFMFPVYSTEAPDLKYTAGMFAYNANNSKSKPINVDTGGWSYAIPKGAKHLEAAWEWDKYITAGEGNKKFVCIMQGRPSPVRAYTEDPAMFKISPLWQIVIDTMKTAVPVPTPPAWPSVTAALDTMVQEALFHKKDVKTAITDGATAVQKALDTPV